MADFSAFCSLLHLYCLGAILTCETLKTCGIVDPAEPFGTFHESFYPFGSHSSDLANGCGKSPPRGT